MSKEKKRVPRLRFPGFTGDWEQRKLKSIANTIVAGGDIDKTKIKEIGTYPVIANALTKEGIVGYYNDDYRIEAPAVTVTGRGDIGVAKARHQNFTPVVRLLSLTTAHDVDFIEHAINNLKIVSESTGVPQLTVPQLSNYKIHITSIIEEQKIGVFISKLDNLITLHQRKLNHLVLKKKSLLQKLFPKNEDRYPELRFPGFTDAWEQREFSDIFAEVKSGLSRMLSNDDIGLPVVRANNINDGQLNLVDDIKYWYKNDPQGANTNNYLIEQGDILINFINSEAKMGTAAYVTRRPERDTIYTTNILRCKVNDEYNPYFIYSLTFLNSYKNYIASITKPAVNQASFTTVDFKKYSIKIPTVKEQNQIADLIETFNKLITLHQRKLDHLLLQKKALLQQMFV